MTRRATEDIQKLKDYFDKRPEVLMAFLFGSRTTGKDRRRSDWDMGVYLQEEGRAQEHEIRKDLERLLSADVDLVILNRAPATVAWRIVGQGEVLVIKNRAEFLNFLLRVSEEADAFYRTSREYYQIFQRSASLGEGDEDRLRRIVTFLEEEIKDYPKFQALSFEEYTRERAKKREVEHWIEHLVNAIVDVAKIILASERRSMPETYGEIIRTLGSVGEFGTNQLCEKISGWIALRNILAHEYLDFRWKNIAEFVSNTEPLWKEFLQRSKEFLKD